MGSGDGSGEMPIARNGVTEFNGGAEYGEAAVGDCYCHNNKIFNRCNGQKENGEGKGIFLFTDDRYTFFFPYPVGSLEKVTDFGASLILTNGDKENNFARQFWCWFRYHTIIYFYQQTFFLSVKYHFFFIQIFFHLLFIFFIYITKRRNLL